MPLWIYGLIAAPIIFVLLMILDARLVQERRYRRLVKQSHFYKRKRGV